VVEGIAAGPRAGRRGDVRVPAPVTVTSDAGPEIQIVARVVGVVRFALQPQQPRAVLFVADACVDVGTLRSPSSASASRRSRPRLSQAVASVQCVLPDRPTDRGGARGQAQDPPGPPRESRHPNPGSIRANLETPTGAARVVTLGSGGRGALPEKARC
jgi:hypothetical protein